MSGGHVTCMNADLVGAGRLSSSIPGAAASQPLRVADRVAGSKLHLETSQPIRVRSRAVPITQRRVAAVRSDCTITANDTVGLAGPRAAALGSFPAPVEPRSFD